MIYAKHDFEIDLTLEKTGSLDIINLEVHNLHENTYTYSELRNTNHFLS